MNEKICRLCQESINNNNWQAVEESLLKSLKLNVNKSKDNVMCMECANCLRVFSNFTSGCVYTGDGALHLSDLENGVKLESESMETTSTKSLMETKIKCSFCTKTHGREDLISLTESKENKFLLNMLEQYTSEMNLKNNEELLTCETCLGALQGGLSVILKCLKLERTDDKDQIELREVQQFTFGPKLKLKNESVGVNELAGRYDQVKEEYTVMAKAEIKYEKGMGDTELIIKTEGDDIKSEQSDCDGFQEPFLLTHKSPSEIKMFKCELCPFEGKRKYDLKRHLLVHKSPSEIKMFKCALCSYEAKLASNLKQHLLTHTSRSEKRLFKCELCPYKAKQRSHLNGHLLVHKSPSEIKTFKCELCPYNGKRKRNLKDHLLSHKSPSEIKMFKCELCPYEAKLKNRLKKHLLTHKSPSEIEMFKCELCPYEAIRKGCLIRHLVTHKSTSEIKMFKCELCSYEAKLKSRLKKHSLIHKSRSERNIFKCELCPYEAKLKSRLEKHLLTHKSRSEIKMFKCELCLYAAKQKRSLKRHLLIHKSPSEIKTLKCD